MRISSLLDESRKRYISPEKAGKSSEDKEKAWKRWNRWDESSKKKEKKKEERKEREREREREPFGRRGEAVETPPTRFLCGPQLCCFFGPRNETLPANNPTRVLIFADDPALTGEETSWPSPSPRKKLNTTSAAKDFRLLQILSLQRTFLIHFIGFSILAQPWKSHWARLRHAIRLGRYYRRLNFAARRGALNAHAFYGFRFF